jgi:hypothetical protein
VDYPGYPGDVMDFVGDGAGAGITALLSAWDVFTGFFSVAIPDAWGELNAVVNAWT